ncbi:hypothetical protein AB0F57_10355 [Streptomyces tanashiensis]|uniref:hypothetical protein n=1 Tax=Streptomyces tanashiensis TaxID=67367 RepID=UPI0033C8FBE2
MRTRPCISRSGWRPGGVRILLAAWIAADRYFANRPVVARALSRWEHILLPIVLIGIGSLILEGGAFGCKGH